MFLSSAAVMIATQIIGVVAIIIDGVITGWKLGMEAYLAISLIHPFVTIVLTLAGFISLRNHKNIILYHLHYICFHETWNHAFTPDSHYCGPGFFSLRPIRQM